MSSLLCVRFCHTVTASFPRWVRHIDLPCALFVPGHAFESVKWQLNDCVREWDSIAVADCARTLAGWLKCAHIPSGRPTSCTVNPTFGTSLDQLRCFAVSVARGPIVVIVTGDRACGYRGIKGLLKVCRQRDLQVKTVDLRNSGDTSEIQDEERT